MRIALALVTVMLLQLVVARAQSIERRLQTKAPPPTRSRLNDGRYNPGRDGRYRSGGDGRYRPAASDGRYVHQDFKYVHDGRAGGAYAGGAERYKPSQGHGGSAAASGFVAGSGSAAVSRSSGLSTRGGGASVGGGSPPAVRVSQFSASDVVSGGRKPSRPQKSGGVAASSGWKTLRLANSLDQNGYHYLYETENGILAEESGQIEQLTATDVGLRAKGFFEYTGDDGVLYRIDYIADDNGFVPQGAHVPPVPAHVPKLLAYLATNAARQ